MRRRIYVASCRNLPDWEQDDATFLDALNEEADVTVLPWDQPGVDFSTFEAVLLRTTWDYTQQIDKFLAWVRWVSGQTRLFNPFVWIQWNHHKRYLSELAKSSIAIVPTISVLPNQLAEGLDELGACERWFMKPMVGASSEGTFRVDDRDLVNSTLGGVDNRFGYLVQPYLSSVETFGELSVICIDGQPSHAVRKVPVNGDYRVQDDYGAHDEPFQLDEQLYSLSASIIREACVITGQTTPPLYARVDFLKGAGGHYLLNELELIEPSLFFRHSESSARKLLSAFLERL